MPLCHLEPHLPLYYCILQEVQDTCLPAFCCRFAGGSYLTLPDGTEHHALTPAHRRIALCQICCLPPYRRALGAGCRAAAHTCLGTLGDRRSLACLHFACLPVAAVSATCVSHLAPPPRDTVKIGCDYCLLPGYRWDAACRLPRDTADAPPRGRGIRLPWVRVSAPFHCRSCVPRYLPAAGCLGGSPRALGAACLPGGRSAAGGASHSPTCLPAWVPLLAGLTAGWFLCLPPLACLPAGFTWVVSLPACLSASQARRRRCLPLVWVPAACRSLRMPLSCHR